jgi:isopropylmalate/homocitrate/citramalate synthase
VRKPENRLPSRLRPCAPAVIIFDTTLRDGEQALQASLSVKEKLQIALALERHFLPCNEHKKTRDRRGFLTFSRFESVFDSAHKSTAQSLNPCFVLLAYSVYY